MCGGFSFNVTKVHIRGYILIKDKISLPIIRKIWKISVALEGGHWLGL